MRDYFFGIRYEYKHWKRIERHIRQLHVSMQPGYGLKVVELVKHRDAAKRAFFRSLIGRY